ncbi:hypothetical protein BSU04_18965 [Caballeronia sordidicola]|uniref:Uncharacterized protein n=1 Tax=Caballeronia sordidicola TaxID=196367 RepID=A0A226X0X8_CABSO|nr:hypothetical protein BSU04_18965 [Caballeronia sordidicola]
MAEVAYCRFPVLPAYVVLKRTKLDQPPAGSAANVFEG